MGLAARGRPRPDRVGTAHSSGRGEARPVSTGHDRPVTGHRGRGGAGTAARYEFRLAEPLSPTARAAFPELSQGVALGGDMLYGPVANQEQLHSLLARFGTMGLTVTELRMLPD